MREIRFVSGDGESLTLETIEGEKLRLTVDDHVRDAIRKQPSVSGDHVLSPREIQDAIRTGSTVAGLVAASGDSEEFISRFAKPVLEELEHMVASALAVRVEIEPDRFNEIRHREFGELILERLRNGGASGISWSASRETPLTWLICADFETMGGTGRATWTFDPRHVVLSPENETAVGLSNQGGFGDAPIPKLQAIVPTNEREPEAARDTSATDLLDAFKERREAAAAMVETQDEPSPEAPKKGRAPMPSWDEIVFGAKSED